jgi:hypothetical protein
MGVVLQDLGGITMQRTQRGEGVVGRIETETVIAGVSAGFVMALAEVIASVVSGQSPFLPFRGAASILLRDDAFRLNAPMVSLVGAFIHLSIAVMFGFAYGVINSSIPWSDRVRGPRQALLGVVFGTAIWLLDFQFIARLFYPWLLEQPQFLQWAIHAFAFGVPLGLLFAEREPPLRVGEKPERRS